MDEKLKFLIHKLGLGEGRLFRIEEVKLCFHTVFYSNGWRWLEEYYCYETFSIVVITLK